MTIKIANEIIEIINLIKRNGYEAYIVGGYIRDLMLNKESFDVDITTSATPNNLKKIFEDYNLEENFIELGSIKFKTDNYRIEITTFRKEYDYINHRKPSKVEFATSLKEDLIRRDFTINALCSDGEKLVDLFNGIEDLKNKKIRTIGDPMVRFEEDALRILRALRFASKLNFCLDEATKKSIYENYKYLDLISFDTKYRELKGILEGTNYFNVLKKYNTVLKSVFNLDDLDVSLFKEMMNYEEKEALFFYFSNNKINNKYLYNKNLNFINDKIDLKKKLKKYGKENIFDILYFKSKILNKNINEFNLLKNILDNNECYNLKMLDIKGEDLLNINIKNNKIGKHLNRLLDAVMENKCVNEKKELLKYLKNNKLD